MNKIQRKIYFSVCICLMLTIPVIVALGYYIDTFEFKCDSVYATEVAIQAYFISLLVLANILSLILFSVNQSYFIKKQTEKHDKKTDGANVACSNDEFQNATADSISETISNEQEQSIACHNEESSSEEIRIFDKNRDSCERTNNIESEIEEVSVTKNVKCETVSDFPASNIPYLPKSDSQEITLNYKSMANTEITQKNDAVQNEVNSKENETQEDLKYNNEGDNSWFPLFKGKFDRGTYVVSYMFLAVMYVGFSFMSESAPLFGSLMTTLVSLTSIIVKSKRCRDVLWSPWASILPLVGFILLFLKSKEAESGNKIQK